MHQAAGDVAQGGAEVGGEVGDPGGAQTAAAATRCVSPASTPTVSIERICSPSSRPPPPLLTWSISSGLFSASSLR